MATDLAQVTLWRVATRDGQRIFTALSGRREGALYKVALPAITLNPSEQDIVGWYTQQAQQEDPRVTQDFASLADHNAGELEGVQYRVKGVDSLTRKVRDRMSRGGDPRSWISDALRYTMVFSPEDYSAQVRDVLYGLDEKGYKVSGGDNSWQRGDSYSDLSYTIYTPDGFPVELQFHTQDSFDLKQKTLHKMYEEFRDSATPMPRKQELYDTMTRKWDEVDIPDDVMGWGTPKLYPRPAHVAAFDKVAARVKVYAAADLSSMTDQALMDREDYLNEYATSNPAVETDAIAAELRRRGYYPDGLGGWTKDPTQREDYQTGATAFDGEPLIPLGARVEARVEYHARRTAHRSLDPQAVLHCYSCGSGNLIGRPDDSVACSFCGAVFSVIAEPSFIGTPGSVDGDAYAQDPAPPPEQPSAVAPPDAPAAPKDDAPEDDPPAPKKDAPPKDDAAAKDDDPKKDDNSKPAKGQATSRRAVRRAVNIRG